MSSKNYVKRFYDRMEEKVILDKKIKNCKLCSGLNQPGTENAPGYGDVCSPIFFVGQSLCDKCRLTQIPFTRGSGDALDEVFYRVKKTKANFFITNVVHCHPPKNRSSSKEEIKNCSRFLQAELELVKPKMIIALGTDAKRAVQKLVKCGDPLIHQPKRIFLFSNPCKLVWVYHPAYFMYGGGIVRREAWSNLIIGLIKETLDA